MNLRVRRWRVDRRIVGAVWAALGLACAAEELPSPEEGAARVRAAEVPMEHARGGSLYAARCAACHGAHGEGTGDGPPMLHPLQATHHGDFAFRRAVSEGVAPHHYRFGTMPPVSALEAAQVDAIIGYVRWMQQTAGLR